MPCKLAPSKIKRIEAEELVDEHVQGPAPPNPAKIVKAKLIVVVMSRDEGRRRELEALVFSRIRLLIGIVLEIEHQAVAIVTFQSG